MIKQWLKKRKIAQQDQSYRDGFGWAMSAYFIEGKSGPEIESYIDTANIDNSGTHYFDLGALRALRIIKTYMSRLTTG